MIYSMKLPISLRDKSEWTVIGPMGPEVIPSLQALPAMAVDGGAQFISKTDVWIGDGDSHALPPQTSCRFDLEREKNSSDLACALSLFSGAKLKLHLWGFLGGRKDHELFVLGECSAFLERSPGSSIVIYDEQKIAFTFFAAGDWKLSHTGIFSLGTIREAQAELKGQIRYPIPPGMKISPLSSFGLSNEASGDFELKISSPAFLYYPEMK